jgi:hypothetical protein
MNFEITHWNGIVDRPADLRLSRTALEAANQIDELISNRKFDPRPVNELAKMISESFSLEEGGIGSNSFIDSGTVAVFLTASEGETVTSMSDLVTKATEIVRKLQKPAEDKDGLKGLREFCLALASAAAAIPSFGYIEETESQGG